jgi:2-haloacid dehalogenase
MRYPVVLLDLDHCLLDSHASEQQAYDEALRSVGVADPAALFPTYERINGALWMAVERGEVSPNDVRFLRFEQFVAETGINADSVAMADAFIEGLGAKGELYPGIETVLAELATATTLGLVTNGIGQVQRTRIARLGFDRFFSAYIISGEAGVAKPNPEIFDRILSELGNPDRADVLMVGDSLTSDIAGGRNARIHTCWYNPNGVDPGAQTPDHIVSTLDELPAIVRTADNENSH